MISLKPANPRESPSGSAREICPGGADAKDRGSGDETDYDLGMPSWSSGLLSLPMCGFVSLNRSCSPPKTEEMPQRISPDLKALWRPRQREAGWVRLSAPGKAWLFRRGLQQGTACLPPLSLGT